LWSIYYNDGSGETQVYGPPHDSYIAISNQDGSAPNPPSLTIYLPGSYRVFCYVDSTTPGDIGNIVASYTGYSDSMDLRIWKNGETPGARDVAWVSTFGCSSAYTSLGDSWISGSLGHLSVYRESGNPQRGGSAVFGGSAGQPGVGGDVGTIYADYLSTTIGGDVTGTISCRVAYLDVKGSLVEDWSTKHATIVLGDVDGLGGGYDAGSITIEGPGPHTGRIYVGAVNASTCNPPENRRHIGTVSIPNAEFVGWVCSSDLTAGSMTVPSNWDIGFGQYARINCTIINDPGAPTVTSVYSETPNGTYKVDDSIAIAVKFSHNVYMSGGSPTLTLATGDVQRVASYDHGDGSRILVFTYTLQAGDESSDLDYASTSALTLPPGVTLKDNCNGGYQHDAVLTLPTPGAAGSLGANNNLVIDGVAPTILWMMPLDGSRIRALPFVRVAFSEAVSFADGHGPGT
jgi:hypothetical protein